MRYKAIVGTVKQLHNTLETMCYAAIFVVCRNPVAGQRVHPSEISRALQKSDRTLLPSRATLKDSEELSTTLGASLDTSSHIFADLQGTYSTK